MNKAMEIIQTKHGEQLKQEAVEEYKAFIFLELFVNKATCQQHQGSQHF